MKNSQKINVLVSPNVRGKRFVVMGRVKHLRHVVRLNVRDFRKTGVLARAVVHHRKNAVGVSATRKTRAEKWDETKSFVIVMSAQKTVIVRGNWFAVKCMAGVWKKKSATRQSAKCGHPKHAVVFPLAQRENVVTFMPAEFVGQPPIAKLS